jgi:hypothetical protein
MFGLSEVSYGDLVIDLGGVLRNGWISRDRVHCVALQCAFRIAHSALNGDYKIAQIGQVMKPMLSHETVGTMKSPIAKIAVMLVSAAALVLAFQILQRL